MTNKKIIALLRINTHFERLERKPPVFVENNLRESFKFIIYVVLFFTVFCRFLRPYRRYCPNIKKLVCLSNFLSCAESKWEIPCGQDGLAQVGN